MDAALAEQYREAFTKHKVDGTMLLQLEETDLEVTMGVTHALHRRKLLIALERLREEEFEVKWGTGPNDLDEFIATLDSDRIRLVARLKVVFDRVDGDSDGVVSFFELRAAFEELGRNLAASDMVRTWMAESEKANGTYSFPEFVGAYSLLFSNEDPDVRLSESQAHFNKEIKLLRDQASGKVTHVKLRSARDRETDEALAGGSDAKKKLDQAGTKPLVERWLDDDDDEGGSSDRGGSDKDDRDKDRRRGRGRSRGSDSEGSDVEEAYEYDKDGKRVAARRSSKRRGGDKTSKLAEESIRSVSRLAEVKEVFDRFQVDGLLTSTEVVSSRDFARRCRAMDGWMDRYQRNMPFLVAHSLAHSLPQLFLAQLNSPTPSSISA